MANAGVDEYIARTIREGDKGSKLLAAKVAPTLAHPLVDRISEGMGGINVLRPPADSLIVVHSSGGDHSQRDLRQYVNSVVEKMVSDSVRIGAEPMGFGDVVDASSMDLKMIAAIGDELRACADHYLLPVMNGELADLGARVNCQANLSGTIISALPKNSRFARAVPGVFEHGGVTYAVFDPKGQAVFINCDGIGTKTEFYERVMENVLAVIEDRVSRLELGFRDGLRCGVEDFAAMNLDDTAKLGATARVLSGVLETRGKIPAELVKEKLKRITEAFGVLGILQHEDVRDRIQGYYPSADTYNISGSAVSTIDENRLRNLPKPLEGDTLIAIRGESNPRSNGITAKRKTMVKILGEKWHQTFSGEVFLEYLTSPSTILYPTFSRLLQEGLATSVFHNSGGAYNGKLARPLAKHNLFVDLGDRLFQPDWREVTLAAYSLSVRDAYEKWPMGTDGFVSSSRPEEAVAAIKEAGLEARPVGRLEKARGDASGRYLRTGEPVTGVRLEAFNGQEVYFSGRD